MVVIITISLAGAGTGPFDLYSDSDGFLVPFETGVSKAALEAGYTSNVVPNDATLIRVASTGACTDFVTVSIAMENTTTTTTTTTLISTTTTTTSTEVPTTTTTTTSDVIIDLCCSIDGNPEGPCFIQSATLGQSCTNFGYFDCTNPLGCPV